MSYYSPFQAVQKKSGYPTPELLSARTLSLSTEYLGCFWTDSMAEVNSFQKSLTDIEERKTTNPLSQSPSALACLLG